MKKIKCLLVVLILLKVNFLILIVFTILSNYLPILLTKKSKPVTSKIIMINHLKWHKALSLNQSSEGIVLTGFKIFNNHYFGIDPNATNLALIGISRSGKGTLVIIPTILSFIYGNASKSGQQITLKYQINYKSLNETITSSSKYIKYYGSITEMLNQKIQVNVSLNNQKPSLIITDPKSGATRDNMKSFIHLIVKLNNLKEVILSLNLRIAMF